MTNPKKEETKKSKIEINRRVVSGKKKPDLFAKFRNDEHPLDSIVTSKPENPTLDYPTLPDTTIGETTLPYPTLDHPKLSLKAVKPDVKLKDRGQKSNPTPDDLVQTTVSPAKNFTKVSNSVVKQAVPDGLFRGQSKHTYDVLYQATRGAISPKREIQLKKADLVKLTGLEIKTIQRHLSFLRSTGLIRVDPKIGDHNGAIYEVKVPEEVALPYPTLPQSTLDQTSIVETGAKSIPDPTTNSTSLGSGKTHENKEFNSSLKTSLKTNTNDDDNARVSETFSLLVERLDEAAQKLTGKPTTKREAERWASLADLLVLELETAASRTSGISSVPAFLTEILRRQFFSSKQFSADSQSSASKTRRDTVGQSNSEIPETFEIKSLDKQGRELALEYLTEFANEDFLKDFQKWYTPDDWQWLIGQLSGNPSTMQEIFTSSNLPEQEIPEE